MSLLPRYYPGPRGGGGGGGGGGGVGVHILTSLEDQPAGLSLGDFGVYLGEFYRWANIPIIGGGSLDVWLPGIVYEGGTRQVAGYFTGFEANAATMNAKAVQVDLTGSGAITYNSGGNGHHVLTSTGSGLALFRTATQPAGTDRVYWRAECRFGTSGSTTGWGGLSLRQSGGTQAIFYTAISGQGWQIRDVNGSTFGQQANGGTGIATTGVAGAWQNVEIDDRGATFIGFHCHINRALGLGWSRGAATDSAITGGARWGVRTTSGAGTMTLHVRRALAVFWTP